jgi:hypothetical protein
MASSAAPACAGALGQDMDSTAAAAAAIAVNLIM